MARVPAFQAGYAGSIPVTRSTDLARLERRHDLLDKPHDRIRRAWMAEVENEVTNAEPDKPHEIVEERLGLRICRW